MNHFVNLTKFKIIYIVERYNLPHRMKRAASADARIDLVRSHTMRYERGTVDAPRIVQN